MTLKLSEPGEYSLTGDSKGTNSQSGYKFYVWPTITNEFGMTFVKCRVKNALIWVGRSEVTIREYDRVMKGTELPAGQPQLPKGSILLSEVRDFLEKLNGGHSVLKNYRLLQEEAEHEILRGSATSDEAVHSIHIEVNKVSTASPVGSKGPDLNGLWDILGNLGEFVAGERYVPGNFGTRNPIQLRAPAIAIDRQTKLESFFPPTIGFRVIAE